MFWGRLTRIKQPPGESLTEFSGHLKYMAIKAYTEELIKNRGLSVVRRLRNEIKKFQFCFVLGRIFVDAELTNALALKKAQLIGALQNLRQKTKKPKVANFQLDSTVRLNISDIKLLEISSLTLSENLLHAYFGSIRKRK